MENLKVFPLGLTPALFRGYFPELRAVETFRKPVLSHDLIMASCLTRVPVVYNFSPFPTSTVFSG
jgi:hypothetical protein